MDKIQEKAYFNIGNSEYYEGYHIKDERWNGWARPYFEKCIAELFVNNFATRDFQIVYQNGKSYANKYLVMYVLKNDLSANRIGISVSKKVGNSVVRHRLTRLIRESYRLHEEMFNSGLDIVVIARATAKSILYTDMESALLHLAKLHGILHEADQKMI